MAIEMSGELVVMDLPSTASPRTPRTRGAADFESSPVAESETTLADTTPTDTLSSASAEASDARVGAASTSMSHLIAAYYELTKPRIVMMILIVTAMASLFASGASISWLMLFHLMIGTALVAGSASAANQYLERLADARMPRTMRRPLPSGRITPIRAIAFGVSLGVLGTIYLAWSVNATTAWVGVATWIGYVVIYTPMKQVTAWNTSVGAVAGALPMLMGYTATGGSVADATGWLLVAVLFLWQYPHFMAIAWLYRKQYAEAGFVMTTTIEPSGRSAGWQAVAGAIALPLVMLVLLSPLPHPILMGALGIVASAGMIRSSFRFRSCPDDSTARKLLLSSLFQLPASLAVLVIARFL